jgi:hypothetical protein
MVGFEWSLQNTIFTGWPFKPPRAFTARTAACAVGSVYGCESTGLPTAVSSPTSSGDFVAVEAVDVAAGDAVEAASVADGALLLVLVLPHAPTATPTTASIARAIATRGHLWNNETLIGSPHL